MVLHGDQWLILLVVILGVVVVIDSFGGDE